MEIPKAFIFDLDGVLTDTVNYHYQAWKDLANSLNLHFDHTINEKLKGVSRIRSFEIILEENSKTENFTKEEIEKYSMLKNEAYVDSIKNITPNDVLPGIKDFLKLAQENNIPCAVASASKNAFFVLKQLNILDMFDYVADANLIKNAKPDPEVFLNCAESLSVEPSNCVAFEDAEAGIYAIIKAGMFSVGINVVTKDKKPDISFKSTNDLDFQDIINKYNDWKI